MFLRLHLRKGNNRMSRISNELNILDSTCPQKLYSLVLSCGNVHDPKGFVAKFLGEVKAILPYDQAMIHFLNENGKICDKILINIDEYWNSAYLSYFANSDLKKYSITAGLSLTPDKYKIGIHNWEKEESREFVPYYIKPRGVKHSCGFALYDIDNRARVNLGFDRTGQEGFRRDEILNLRLILPSLNNLHKNFYYQQQVKTNQILYSNNADNEPLTSRENQVANLLCQGMSPSNISRTLMISLSTTNKHIARIYKKYKVSSRQELLVRMLGQQS